MLFFSSCLEKCCKLDEPLKQWVCFQILPLNKLLLNYNQLWINICQFNCRDTEIVTIKTQKIGAGKYRTLCTHSTETQTHSRLCSCRQWSGHFRRPALYYCCSRGGGGSALKACDPWRMPLCVTVMDTAITSARSSLRPSTCWPLCRRWSPSRASQTRQVCTFEPADKGRISPTQTRLEVQTASDLNHRRNVRVRDGRATSKGDRCSFDRRGKMNEWECRGISLRIRRSWVTPREMTLFTVAADCSRSDREEFHSSSTSSQEPREPSGSFLIVVGCVVWHVGAPCELVFFSLCRQDGGSVGTDADAALMIRRWDRRTGGRKRLQPNPCNGTTQHRVLAPAVFWSLLFDRVKSSLFFSQLACREKRGKTGKIPLTGFTRKWTEEKWGSFSQENTLNTLHSSEKCVKMLPGAIRLDIFIQSALTLVIYFGDLPP